MRGIWSLLDLVVSAIVRHQIHDVPHVDLWIETGHFQMVMLKSQQVVAPPRVLRPHETIRVHLHSHVSDLHEVLLQELVQLKLLALCTKRRIFYGGVIQSYLVECPHVSACELHCVSHAHT